MNLWSTVLLHCTNSHLKKKKGSLILIIIPNTYALLKKRTIWMEHNLQEVPLKKKDFYTVCTGHPNSLQNKAIIFYITLPFAHYWKRHYYCVADETLIHLIKPSYASIANSTGNTFITVNTIPTKKMDLELPYQFYTVNIRTWRNAC